MYKEPERVVGSILKQNVEKKQETIDSTRRGSAEVMGWEEFPKAKHRVQRQRAIVTVHLGYEAFGNSGPCLV